MGFAMSSYRQGDTIIEVILAVAIFSMVAVGAISIMNSGVSIAQQSLEITLVRSEMKVQAESVRYIHQQYIDGDTTATAEWEKMVDDQAQTAPTAYGALTSNGRCLPGSSLDQPYALDVNQVDDSSRFMTTRIRTTGSAGSSLPYAHFDSDGASPTSYGLWIETVRKDVNQNFVDFHIRACWDSVGKAIPTTLGTIVRLYVPEE